MKKELKNNLEKKIKSAKQYLIRYQQKKYCGKGIDFVLEEKNIYSDNIAFVIFSHYERNRKVGVIFYSMAGEWNYLLPTESHLLGLRRLIDSNELLEIERFNYNSNYDGGNC